ncbi:transposon Tf2-8 polyprotein [Trichonephila clavipes]|nr:transposon Tf2-8 polyprotein [Trichonephila clavipes]
MIADQMKKKCSPEFKEHYLNIWEELIIPEMLADKLEIFDNIRRSLPCGPRKHVKASETVNDGRQVSFRKPESHSKSEYSYQVPHTCNLNTSQRTDVATNHINAYTARNRSPRLTLIDITFCGIKGRVCADTGSSHSIAGEKMFQIFKDKGLLFQETTLAMSLSDRQQTTGEALTTQVMVEIEGRSVLTKFIILPKAKGNRKLLEIDFSSFAGLVLDVMNTCWYFGDNPNHKYPFGEELDTPSIVEKMSSNTCQLRKGEGESLTTAQKEKLNLLLESFQNVFEPGGEATKILKHPINTGNSPPISVPPYRMSPVKNCPDCIKHKASNQKPSGLLQTPVPAQRFETLVIDFFGPLPESKDGKRWILIIEDCTTKWVEVFALPNATAKECVITLIEEVLLRYGIPRRLISDNGAQFVSPVMQQICYLLNIHQSLIPVYHPQANPVERKNRDLKHRLAILVQDKHDCRSEKLPFTHFALNTAKCETTGHTAAFLNFGTELRSPSEVVNDIRVVIQNDNFVLEITPYLKKFAQFSTQIREVVEEQQDSRKFYAAKKRKTAPTYQTGKHVVVASHPLSNVAQGRSAKLMPRSDGPYVILTQRSPSS